MVKIATKIVFKFAKFFIFPFSTVSFAHSTELEAFFRLSLCNPTKIFFFWQKDVHSVFCFFFLRWNHFASCFKAWVLPLFWKMNYRFHNL